jgi:capsular exopolysaccharide synthesis family protein
VLDPAVAPHRPIKNTAHRFIVVGLMAGFWISIVGVVLADRLDRRLHYPQQVTREMGLPIIGAVPRFAQRRDGPAATDVAQVVEALRTVRLNVAHAYGAMPSAPIVITITSPGPGDGKSFVAGNLARAFADAGQRTLLIDGDTRRGVLHRMLNTLRKPGLVDHLTGAAALERVVQRTDHPLLEFVGSGARQGDTPELLSSQAMAQFLAYARTAYQVVLVDSPPLGAGVDPFVLGTLTGSLLIVLRTGATDRELAASKLEGIERLPIRVLGAVLNDVEPRGVYRYYGYLTGYSAEAEPRMATVMRR